MRIFISLIFFVIISGSVFGQEKCDDNYLKEWDNFKKKNAPFNDVKREDFAIVVLAENSNLKLGDLSYKREKFTTGQELIGVALHVTAAIKYNLDCKNEIWKDPAKYFVEGYY
ncbi:hypothetical protein [Labilibaculum antarcticum]|uniref:Uncharacterized protein n=1 Tax=Labilibaculum antarcticum TaxID=1717717 RepID=A0A1Y1CNA7_9BACT|nr:hypothetical protein [Labilibaculum antarcticum]BAX81896.1 hypothetical protein ALGA_3604 [Labilibaculum antarcticum]